MSRKEQDFMPNTADIDTIPEAEHTEDSQTTKKNTFIGAATISTIGIFLVRFLSLAYLIPYRSLVEGQIGAQYVYGSATSLYTPFYELSLAGLPMAIAYLVAMYNSKKEYATSNRILVYTQRIMMLLGFVSMLAFILIAPYYADNRTAALAAEIPGFQNGIPIANYLQHVLHHVQPEVIAPALQQPFAFPAPDMHIDLVYKYLIQAMLFISPALFLTPILSGMRGYLQGYKIVLGNSISQVVEQLIRIIFMLAILYFGLNKWAIYAESAMAYAMLAIPLSVFAGIICVYPFFRTVRREHKQEIVRTGSVSKESTKELLSIIIKTALPFVLAGLATNLYTQVTTFTFVDTAIASGIPKVVAMDQYMIIIEWTGKIVSIPLTFALAFSGTIVSFITAAFAAGDRKEVRRFTVRSYRMTLFFTLTTVIGMAALMYPLMTTIYGVSSAESMSSIARLDSFRGMLFALLSITTSILQALGEKNRAVVYTLIGPVLKLALNIPFVRMWGMYGDVAATMVGISVVVFITSVKIMQISGVRPGPILKSFCKIVLAATPMVAVILAVNAFANMSAYELVQGRFGAMLHLGIGFILGAPVFLIVADRIGLISETFGKDVSLRNFIQKAILKR